MNTQNAKHSDTSRQSDHDTCAPHGEPTQDVRAHAAASRSGPDESDAAAAPAAPAVRYSLLQLLLIGVVIYILSGEYIVPGLIFIILLGLLLLLLLTR